MRTKLRSKVTLLFVVCAALLAIPAIAMALTADTSGSTSPAPTIQSDKADYAPGELVTLTGGNWQPGESVHIYVNDDEGNTWSRNVDVTADASGNISDSFNLPDWFVATYKVTATGAQSGMATTTFTDGNVQVRANLSGTETWTLTKTVYTASSDCSGTGTSTTSTITGNDQNTTGLGSSTQSVKLQASANSSGGTQVKVFDGWTAVDNAPYTNLDERTICVQGFKSGRQDYRANYVVNQAPVANNDSLTTNEDTAGNVNVLTNDTDANGDTLTVTNNTNGANGSASCTTAGVCTYTPSSNSNGSDSFTYTVSDGKGGTATGTVNVTVTAVNDAPSFTKGANETVAEDAGAQTVTGWATNISKGPADENGQTLSFEVTNNTNTALFSTQPSIAPDGTLSYTPAANASGTATVSVKLKDDGGTANGGANESAVQTFTITVTAVNDAPDAVNDAKTTAEDTATNINVLANDTDVDGDSLSVSSFTQPSHGTVSENTDGTLNYNPAANYNGSDSFTYTVSDGNGGTDTATVNLTVTAVNDAPIVTLSGAATPNEGQTTTYTFAVNDPDSGATFTVKSGFPDCGTGGNYIAGSLNTTASGGTFDCRFPDGPANTDVKIQVTDGQADSNIATKSVTVANVIPTIGPLTVTGNSGTACIGSTNVVTLSFSITDPGVDTPHSGTINWGDGTTTTFSGSSVTQQHSYSAGTYNITVNASDSDGGNAAQATTTGTQPSVSLLYNVSQLQDPVNPTGMTMSVFKYGSTVPMRVLITDCNNQPVNGLVPSISFSKVSAATPAIGINEVLSTQPNDNNLLMRDAGNGQYIYNLNTKSLPDGDATYNATIRDSKATQTAPATYGPKVTQNFGLRSK